MIVTIHLSATVDSDLRREKKVADNSTGSSRVIRELLSTYGLKPKPLFSEDRGSATDSIWHLECPSNKAAEVVEKLLRTPGVEAAYIKPPDDLPSPP